MSTKLPAAAANVRGGLTILVGCNASEPNLCKWRKADGILLCFMFVVLVVLIVVVVIMVGFLAARISFIIETKVEGWMIVM